MTLFYTLILILVIGAGAIAWIMFAEKKKESPQPEKTKETAPQLSPKELLGRLGLESPKSTTDKLILPELFKKPASSSENKTTHISATSKTNPPSTETTESELSLKYDELLSEKNQLKAEHTKLETLFIEKSMLLEKSEKTLNNELKNQKEFNKVKDILEKEIRDYKDKVTVLQNEITSAQTEIQTQSKRVSQLEEKIKKFEIEILTSEDAINDAQASTQLARKHSTELEEKIQSLENQILDKNQKIEDLVRRLKDLPNVFPGNTLPDSQASLNQQAEVETTSKTPEQAIAQSSSTAPEELTTEATEQPQQKPEKTTPPKTQPESIVAEASFDALQEITPETNIQSPTTQQQPKTNVQPPSSSNQPPPKSNDVQQGGEGEQSKLSQEPPILSKPAKENPPEPILANIEAPKVVPLVKQSDNNPIIEKPTDGVLTLPSDILTKQKTESRESPKPNPPDKNKNFTL